MRKKRSKLRKIISISIGVITLAITLLFGFFVLVQALFPSRAIDILGFRTFTVAYTKSMEPTLNYNDLIIVRRYDFMKLEVGDIIAYEAYLGSSTQKSIVTHRIVEIIDEEDGRRYLITMGDSIKIRDTIPITKDGYDDTNIYVGKYVYKSAFLGSIIAFLRSSIGTFVLCYNFGGIILIHLIGAMCRYYERNMQKKTDDDNESSEQTISSNEEISVAAKEITASANESKNPVHSYKKSTKKPVNSKEKATTDNAFVERKSKKDNINPSNSYKKSSSKPAIKIKSANNTSNNKSNAARKKNTKHK